ncbi:cytochrome c [Duganella sp. BuS-21]|uniref:c-type cytochrome n=1 Tax=Duganella sp. BuS-21 TaxID=2943848 RepID=UPI0035A684BA
MRKIVYTVIAFVLAAGLAIAALLAQQFRSEDLGPPASTTNAAHVTPAVELVARGAYLAKAGDCMACHTTRGGQPYAGGRALQTPFGSVISPNITADRATGIGAWSADDFWRALHHGKSKDGRLLYPAFPYTSYAHVTRADADALHAYLRTVPAVSQPNQPNQLRFPYKLQVSLAAWRALYFKPAAFTPELGQSVEWNRGAYLVQGLGHCSACHSARNSLGAEGGELSGAMLAAQGWYAPPLNARGDWQREHLAALLKTGTSARATVFGPMAEVVRESLQHLNDGDIQAIALYLQSLPPEAKPPAYERDSGAQAVAYLAEGAKLYDKHCVDCHGANGLGKPPAYPPLAGNQGLTMDHAVNPIRIVLNGGFAPATAGNPRPFSMPPFGHALSDMETAQVVSYLRSAWGNNAPPVNSTDVNRYRAIPLD